MSGDAPMAWPNYGAAMDSRMLHAIADVGLGRRYGHTGDDTADCVRFVLAVLDQVYPGKLGATGRRDVLISHGDAERPWSPVSALITAGIARVPGNKVDYGRWHVCQGWNGLTGGRISSTSSGHCWLWRGGVSNGQAGWIYQASTSNPAEWVARRTWADQAARFVSGVSVAALVELAPGVG